MAKKQQPSWHRFTFIALLAAILSCVAGGVFLLVKGLVNVNMISGITNETLNKGLIVSGGVVVLALALYLLLEPEKVRRAFTGRQAKYGSNAFIMSLAFLGILIVVNVLIYQNPVEPFDVTSDKQNTLAPESTQALEQLKEPVLATAFYTNSLSTASAEELLGKFKAGSNGNFDYKIVNPDIDPVAAKEAGVTGDGKILLTMGDRKEIAGYASETEITKALYRLLNPEARVIYFLSGHGEASVESGQVSMTTAKRTLENKNYTVKSLNLLVENKIPEDALAIVIAGPMKPVSTQEVTLLKNYLDAGGSLVVMEDPLLVTDFGDASDPLADYLTKDWGITLNNDIIIDLSNNQQPLYAVSASYNQHPITQNLTQNYIVIMPQARSISIAPGLENVTTTELLFTSPNSWGEKNFTTAEGSQISLDPEDLPGPLAMAASGENSQTKGRVVVFGNSIFATNEGFDAYGNGNIFVNALDWAAFQEDAISVTPFTPTTRTFIPPQGLQLAIIILGTALILPGLVVLAGVSTWLARRKQG